MDWNYIRTYLENDDNPHTGADAWSAWGYGAEMKGYNPTQPDIRMRGLNIGRQRDGSVLINAMHIFGVNGLEPASVEQAKKKAEVELPNIVKYIQENIVGFRQASLAGTAEELYIRETRHLIGEYRLTIDDVLEHRDFPDKIVLGGYPVDIQATSINDWGTVVGDPERYSVPYRSLVPLKIEGMLVVGRSASYDSLAHGSARTIPIGMGAGEAAGIAAAYRIENNITFRDIAYNEGAIQSIQASLKDQGALLEDFDIPHSLSNHWAYEGVKFLRYKGLVSGGYNNDYGVDKPITGIRFAKLLQYALDRYDKNQIVIPSDMGVQKETITWQQISAFINSSNLPANIQERMQIEKVEVSQGSAYMIIQWLVENAK